MRSAHLVLVNLDAICFSVPPLAVALNQQVELFYEEIEEAGGAERRLLGALLLDGGEASRLDDLSDVGFKRRLPTASKVIAMCSQPVFHALRAFLLRDRICRRLSDAICPLFAPLFPCLAHLLLVVIAASRTNHVLATSCTQLALDLLCCLFTKSGSKRLPLELGNVTAVTHLGSRGGAEDGSSLELFAILRRRLLMSVLQVQRQPLALEPTMKALDHGEGDRMNSLCYLQHG